MRSSNHRCLSAGRGGGLRVCPSPCASLHLQRMRSFCICQTDVSGGQAAGTQHKGPAGVCWQLPATQEMPPAVNVSIVTNEPSVHPRAGGKQGGGSRRSRGCYGVLTGGVFPPLWGCWVLPTESLPLPQPAALRPCGAGVANGGTKGLRASCWVGFGRPFPRG